MGNGEGAPGFPYIFCGGYSGVVEGVKGSRGDARVDAGAGLYTFFLFFYLHRWGGHHLRIVFC